MKIKCLLVLLLLPLTTLLADQWDEWGVEGRVAYYRPSNKRFRKIYQNGGPDYQIEVTRRLCNDWLGWLNVSWFNQSGHSLGRRHHTRIDFIPVGLGIKRNIYLTRKVLCYVGGGLNFSFIRIKDHYSYVKRHDHRESLGGVIKLGLNYQLTNCFYVGIFADYLIQRFNYKGFKHGAYRRNINADGFKFGGNIGYSF